MDELIYRQAAIGVLNDGAELWRRVLDEPDVVGIERKKYEWGLDLIESYISDIKELSPAQTDSCEGCKHLGYGYPCSGCKRRVEDHYER